MRNIESFEEFVNENNQKDTAKRRALDFVESKGKATWKEIHSFMMKDKGLDPNDKQHRGNMSSYFSGSTNPSSRRGEYKSKTSALHGRDKVSHGILMIPTKQDPRYLEKDGKFYVVKKWDGKTKLDESNSNENFEIYNSTDFLSIQAAKLGMSREEFIATYSPSIGLGIDEGFSTETPKANELGRYFLKLLAVRDQAQLFHWQTNSFAQHEAFGSFYDEFLEDIDDLVETIMGSKGRPIFGQGASIVLSDYTPEAINKFFESLYPLFDNELKMICDEEVDEAIFDLARAIHAKVDKLRYLLTLS